jgi:hypothetical protein
MIDVNRRLFSRLQDVVQEAGLWHQVVRPDGRRYVATTNNEKEILRSARLLASVQCLPRRAVHIVACGSRRFVVLPENPRVLGFVAQSIQNDFSADAGLLTFLWSSSEVSLSDERELAPRLAELVFCKAESYTAQELCSYFEPLKIWEVEPGGVEDEPIVEAFRLYALYLVDSPTLPFSKEAVARIAALLEGVCGRVAGDVLFRAVTAPHWPHAFLELYRCVERLFSVPYLQSLARALDVEVGVLGTHVGDHLKWRPKEDEALIRLIKSSPSLDLSAVHELISKEPPRQGPGAEAVGKFIYNVRNSIAHFRAGGSAVTIDWMKLTEHMVVLIGDLYTDYGVHLR